jgi:hypothetical protein
MRNKKVIFIYIDALNPEIIQPDYMPFLSNLTDKYYIKRLENVLGYSFAIQSSMLSGKYPDENLHWMPYFFSPEKSPILFKTIAKLGHIFPIDSVSPFRSLLERFLMNFFLKKGVKASNIPASVIDKISIYPYYYMVELPFYSTLRQFLYVKCSASLEYFGPPKIKGDKVYYLLLDHLKKHANNYAEFLIVYEDRLDYIGHGFGPYSDEYRRFARYLDRILAGIYRKIKDSFRQNVTFFFFSDHGQYQFKNSLDIISSLARERLMFMKDYACFIDATITLFWSMDNSTKDKIMNALQSIEEGVLVDEKLKEKYHLKFGKKRLYGDIIYVLRPGWTFFPNFFSCSGTMKGLHGYLPENHGQKALLISNETCESKIRHVKDIENLIVESVYNAN